jgi:hypothetical protein
MANQLKIAQVQAPLALYAPGWSARRPARNPQLDRAAVRRPIRLAEEAAASKPAFTPPGSSALLAGPLAG